MYHSRCGLHIHEGPCLRLVARRRRARAPPPCAAAPTAPTATTTVGGRSLWTAIQGMATAATTTPTMAMATQVILGRAPGALGHCHVPLPLLRVPALRARLRLALAQRIRGRVLLPLALLDQALRV